MKKIKREESTLKPVNPPAFPFSIEDTRGIKYNNHTGMTLRDYFAGQVLIGLINVEESPEITSKIAYKVADGMLKEREKYNE